jgi:hypothetical protein
VSIITATYQSSYTTSKLGDKKCILININTVYECDAYHCQAEHSCDSAVTQGTCVGCRAGTYGSPTGTTSSQILAATHTRAHEPHLHQHTLHRHFITPNYRIQFNVSSSSKLLTSSKPYASLARPPPNTNSLSAKQATS